jgi:3D (Asp-Asp-Asp) domain-containing protein
MAAASLLALLHAGCARVGIRPPRGRAPLEPVMIVTGYCNCGECCGWHRTWTGRPVVSAGPSRGRRKAVGVTSAGLRARSGTFAADTSRYPYGTIIHVPGFGYGRVEDTGGAITGDALDIWFPSHARAEAWGRRKLVVQVWLPQPGRPLSPGR